MGGRAIDAIVDWETSPEGAPVINRTVRFPMLRRKPDDTHSSLQFTFPSKDDPAPTLDGRPLPRETFSTAAIHEGLRLTESAGPLRITRIVFPSTELPALIEKWEIKNAGDTPAVVTIPRYLKETKIPETQGKWAAHIMRAEWLGSGD